MRSIKKLKSKGKALAGSALLVGATLTGAAGLAGAADLGDYPQPFVDDDGNVQSTIVVGSAGKQVDVVGAVNIAGSLGNAAFETTQKSTGTGAGSWSASNGVTLDTQNDNLLFSDNISTVRDTLTGGDLDVLGDSTFRDDAGTNYDITQYLNIGDQEITFGNSPDGLDNDDPVLHVPVPAESDVDNETYLVNVQANLDEVNFTDGDVQGEDLNLFGKSWTISDDTSANNYGDDELVLFGSSETVDVQTGESTTVTIDGTEHTLEVESVNSANTAAVRINGELSSEDDGETVVTDSGQKIRLEEIINTGASDDGQGTVRFGLGAEEIKLNSGNAIQDDDDEDIEGTYVQINSNESWTVGDGVSSIDVYLGAEDDENDYLAAGETFSHSMFSSYEVQFGGLNPDTAEGGDNVEEVTVDQNGNQDLQIGFTGDNGDDTSVNFVHRPNENDDSSGLGWDKLANSDNESIVVKEGANVSEDEYVAVDAGDFDHLFEVTNIDRDSTTGSIEDGDEAEIDLRDVVTGKSVTVELEAQSSDGFYSDDEIIDGQTYHFALGGDSGSEFQVTWGQNSDHNTDGSGFGTSVGQRTTVSAAIDTHSGSAIAFTKNVSVSGDVEVPSTQSSGTATFNVGTVTQGSSTEAAGVTWKVDSDADAIYPAGTAGNASAVVIQPEDEDDEEESFVFTPTGFDKDDGYSVTGSGAYNYSEALTLTTLESDSDVDQGYTAYGSFVEQETDDQGTITVQVPSGQSTAGAAITGPEGSISAEGGSGSVETMQPTGWPDAAALDTDSNIGSLKNNENLVLVGGPAVNTLVQELADANQTWTADQYSEGQALVQQVDNAFSQGNDALVVAGYAGEDTREAANYIANYEDHQSDLSGQAQKTITTGQTTQ